MWGVDGVGFSSEKVQFENDRIFVEENDVGGLWYFVPPSWIFSLPVASGYSGFILLKMGHWSFDNQGKGVLPDIDIMLESSDPRCVEFFGNAK